MRAKETHANLSDRILRALDRLPTAPGKGLPEPAKLLVCEKRCPNCLFGPAKLVSDERRDEILANIDSPLTRGSYFTCHKGSLSGNNQLVCRGWYDANPQSLIVRLALQLDVVKFVPVPADTPL